MTVLSHISSVVEKVSQAWFECTRAALGKLLACYFDKEAHSVIPFVRLQFYKLGSHPQKVECPLTQAVPLIFDVGPPRCDCQTVHFMQRCCLCCFRTLSGNLILLLRSRSWRNECTLIQDPGWRAISSRILVPHEWVCSQTRHAVFLSRLRMLTHLGCQGPIAFLGFSYCRSLSVISFQQSP